MRLLEDTPRAKLLEEVGARIRKGLGYRESLAALLLAAIRNVQPRPAVGFKFHAVLVVHSAHLVAQASPEANRWLPLLWAVDHFKESQADDVREGDWTMGAVNTKSIPAKAQAVRAFTTAMDNWDEASADGAAAGLARHLTPEESFESSRAMPFVISAPSATRPSTWPMRGVPWTRSAGSTANRPALPGLCDPGARRQRPATRR